MTATAAILIIGNEILSGKTQDANTSWIAQRLSARGIVLREVRIVRDEEAAVVQAVHALREKYTYVFSTGGIGPTHDDITADCMAAAFGVPLLVHPEAERRLEAHFAKSGTAMNAARLRMARIPEGAALIDNPVSAAPGFKIANVYVMAGVPKIMQAMFEGFEETLAQGPPVLSRSVTAAMKEGDIAEELEAIQKTFPDVEIGSYPGIRDGKYAVTLALRATDAARLDAATEQTATMARKWAGEVVIH